MSKKLLNESTIRRFAGLAGIGADVVSNFINEAYGEDEEKMEEEVVSEEETISEEEEAEEEAEEDMDDMMDMDAEAEEGAEEEADMDMEMDMDAEDEGGEDAEALVSDIVAKLQDLAKMAGVDIDVEMGDEEGDLEEGYGATSASTYKRDDEDEMMEEGEETLEEIINGILDEETEGLEEANCGSDDKMEEAEELEEGEESKTQVQEEVVQEVLRRVRERLAQKTEQ